MEYRVSNINKKQLAPLLEDLIPRFYDWLCENAAHKDYEKVDHEYGRMRKQLRELNINKPQRKYNQDENKYFAPVLGFNNEAKKERISCVDAPTGCDE